MLFGKVHNLLQHHSSRSLIIINLSAISQFLSWRGEWRLGMRVSGVPSLLQSTRFSFLIRMNNYLHQSCPFRTALPKLNSTQVTLPSKLFLSFLFTLFILRSPPALFPSELSKILLAWSFLFNFNKNVINHCQTSEWMSVRFEHSQCSKDFPIGCRMHNQ